MLKNNTVLKIISVLVAIFLWVYVMGEVNPTITEVIENVPVKLLKEDTLAQRGLAISGGDHLTVDVVVTGKRVDLSKLDKNKIKATANIFGYEEGENYIPVLVNPPDGITLVEVKPAKVQVNLEELVSVYKPISVSLRGKTKQGTEPGGISANPTEIEIKGAKSVVNSVSYVQARINATKITDQRQTFTAVPVPIDGAGEPVYDVDLSAKTVEVQAVLYYVKTVPLKVDVVGTVPSAYEMTAIDAPDKVTIRGPKASIDSISSVTAQPVDISQVTASTTLPVKLNLPEHVEVANNSKNLGVEIKIKGLSTKTFTLSTKDSEIKNLRDGLSAYINTAEVTVSVTGVESVVKELAKKDFTLSVDLKGVGMGTRVVPIQVSTGVTVNSLKVKPLKVEITVKDTAE